MADNLKYSFLRGAFKLVHLFGGGCFFHLSACSIQSCLSQYLVNGNLYILCRLNPVKHLVQKISNFFP